MRGTPAEPEPPGDGPETLTGASPGPSDHESFVEKMERAARGVPGSFPADDPDLVGEDRFDAG